MGISGLKKSVQGCDSIGLKVDGDDDGGADWGAVLVLGGVGGAFWGAF